MQIDLTKKEFRRLLDMVYIGNWILNSTRGDDRFTDYDDLESKLFALCREQGMGTLVERFQGADVPSRAFSDGGIHEAIMDYEDTVFYEILARSSRGATWTISPSPTTTTRSSSPAWTNTSPNSRPTAPTISPSRIWMCEMIRPKTARYISTVRFFSVAKKSFRHAAPRFVNLKKFKKLFD